MCGCWNVSLLEDEDLTQEIHLHLQGIGKWVIAMDIVNYLDTPELRTHFKLKDHLPHNSAALGVSCGLPLEKKNHKASLLMAMSEKMLSHIETMSLFQHQEIQGH